MSGQEHRPQNKWQGYARFAPSVYRSLAFVLATAQIFLFSPIYQAIIPPPALIAAVGIYTVIKVLHPLHWHRAGIRGYILLGVDVVVCILLVNTTVGLYSPFLLYTLTPVLTAALFLSGKVTFAIAALSATYVIGSYLFNPFLPTPLSPPALSYFSVYVIAVCLSAVLPYMINLNLRQRLQTQDILQERQRLSHEIHDGTAQTLSALRWQVQLLRRRLTEQRIDLDEAGQLEELAEKAHHDIRESLELLRNYTGYGSFLPYLKDYLEHLSQDSAIDFRLNTEINELPLEARVELELLRICQEALTNVRKHSGARTVQVKIRSVDDHVEVSIADDGCGFDALAFCHDGIEAKGHGLAVMRERAESVGGRFRVLSIPQKGTEIQAAVPENLRPSRLTWLK